MLFGKKKKVSESAQLLTMRNGREIKLLTLRDRMSNNETVLAKEGIINVVENELVISCGNDILMRAPLERLRAYELMNLSGINIIDGDDSYVAYYTKGIENK